MKKIVAIAFFLLIASSAYCQTWNKVAYDNFDAGVYSFGHYEEKLVLSAGYDNERIVTWDEIDIDTIPFGLNASPNCFEVFNDKLIIGGIFSEANNVEFTDKIAQFDGHSTMAVLTSYINNDIHEINAMAVYDGELYIGGIIAEVEGTPVHHIAKWDGNQWSDVGGGINLGNTKVRAMAVYNDELYVAGRFYSAGGIACNNIAKWNGVEWDSVGAGASSYIDCLEVDTANNVLYVGGGFLYAGNKPARCVAKWNGTEWDSLGVGAPYDVLALEMFEGKLFTSVVENNGLITDTLLMSWNGQEWEYLFGFDSNIYALKEYKGNLYAGGTFDRIPGGGYVNAIACYGNNCPEPLGVNELTTEEKNFVIYPNPNSGTFTIRTDEILQSDVEVVITDIAGKQVLSTTIKRNEQAKEINLPATAKGVYACSIYKQKQLVQTDRIVLE